MSKKFNLFFCLLATTCFLSATSYSYDVIKDEDEALLKDIFEAPTPKDRQEVIVKAPSKETLKEETKSLSQEQSASKEEIKKQIEDIEDLENIEIVEDKDQEEIDTTISSITPPAPSAFKDQEELPPLRSILYPTKEERAKNRQQEKEWFNPRTNAPLIPDTMSAKDALDPYLEDIKTSIHSCLNNNQEKLDIESSLITQGNLYDNTAYISKTFEDINTCYESVALNIISTYYNNDPRVLNTFKAKAPTFYIRSTTPSFDASLCGETCSIEALVQSQIAKFKDYRTYLSELLANRPQAKRKPQ